MIFSSVESFFEKTMPGIDLESSQGKLSLNKIESTLSFVTNDDRFIAVFLGGSYPNQRAKRYSDVDVYAFVDDDNFRWRRHFNIVKGVPIELNILSVSFFYQLLGHARKTRYAALLRGLFEAKILKGGDVSASIKNIVSDTLGGQAEQVLDIDKLNRKLRFSLTTKLMDFYQEPDFLKANIVLCSIVGDVASLLNLAAQGWVSNTKHMAGGIEQDGHCKEFLNGFFKSYVSFVSGGDKAVVMDSLIHVLTFYGGGVWDSFEESY
ncbi:hypothetical protein PSTH1771_10070 [Pseudomonas syringae pv. theae]|uniref:hypothetical protein n=1 Tax=Pseudomonas syringae TaxID=317 RepID=UPI001F2AA094|nr:hypothetical protein [Pseudomonas syringae]MBL3828453.1 hypothetical protein [Pseudomonas syringae pv. theae]MBL3833821.1 hypothetical protein [Pseudomonas syringae pv. theae]MBL3866224.1 hypothetical protein [Pseudomonas syringae pv. theae]GKQ47505.1 hypothetical protein PSTH2693_20135 [Pseudomonas syringae pv. theae]GKS05352.1 hypothetical protein PSTH1771_10070 [Pseudomonas syringae pv. theae]